MENLNIDTERAHRLIEAIERDLKDLKQILGTGEVLYNAASNPSYYTPETAEDDGIEGVFDGERMVDFSGKTYQVSANYASKSKLVEGDPLKLYITPDGKFFYKQLGPIERRNVPGILRADGNRYVVDGEDGVSYNVLTASVTYYMSLFNVQPGDRLLLTVPAEGEAHWAVIDNVL
ncbi:MAG: hypothetical protein K0S20_401 [Patescibacteria group bacterium]|jgi:hypothetical protein|nr:hypothetical protein [Patescibacteria group bacterium]